MGKVHFEEFLYRGRSEGDTREPAWHVVLLENVGTSDLHKQTVWHHHTLNIAQAEAAGWPLPEIIKTINIDALKECELLRREVIELRQKIEHLNPAGGAP